MKRGRPNRKDKSRSERQGHSPDDVTDAAIADLLSVALAYFRSASQFGIRILEPVKSNNNAQSYELRVLGLPTHATTEM